MAASSFHRPKPPSSLRRRWNTRISSMSGFPSSISCVPSLTTARIRAEGNAARRAWKVGRRQERVADVAEHEDRDRAEVPPEQATRHRRPSTWRISGTCTWRREPPGGIRAPRRGIPGGGRTSGRKVNGGRKRRSNAVHRTPFFRSSRGSESRVAVHSLDEIGGVHIRVVQQIAPESPHRSRRPGPPRAPSGRRSGPPAAATAGSCSPDTIPRGEPTSSRRNFFWGSGTRPLRVRAAAGRRSPSPVPA